ncbi:MAG: hypothetical protein KIH63_002825 [Candidatus Saccharibacteria bacterium]|nr:hypothetical protein [Candidatus Saccharibacteria bacterium]
MDHPFWRKQTKDSPLFPDLLWSRPENRQLAGKILIIGGNAHGFAAPAEAYQTALASGVGLTRVLLPLAVKGVVGKLLDTIDYAPNTPSGSFAKSALAEWLDHAAWADGVLLAGDFGRNSETAIVLESFLRKYSGQVTVGKDTVDYCLGFADGLVQRENTLLALTMADLQKLFKNTKQPVAITFDMDLIRLAQALHDFSTKTKTALLLKHLDHFVLAYQGKIITTDAPSDLEEAWRVSTAAKAAVWWLQNPSKTLEAVATSLL